MTPALAMARQLDALGLSLIPIPRPRPGVPVGKPGDGKVPSIVWGQYQRRRATDEELVAWFDGEPMNLAVVTGAISGVVVIDADDPAALRWCTQHLKYTPWQTKTTRGYPWHSISVASASAHLRARRHGRLAIDAARWGYVIAPGSCMRARRIAAQRLDRSPDRVDLLGGWLSAPPRPSTHTA